MARETYEVTEPPVRRGDRYEVPSASVLDRYSAGSPSGVAREITNADGPYNNRRMNQGLVARDVPPLVSALLELRTGQQVAFELLDRLDRAAYRLGGDGPLAPPANGKVQGEPDTDCPALPRARMLEAAMRELNGRLERALDAIEKVI